MKQIHTDLIITSIRAKVDGSLGLSATTPELTKQDKVEFMDLQNQELRAVFVPKGNPEAPEYKIEKEVNKKSLSQWLRDIIYVHWQQHGQNTDRETYYKHTITRFGEQLKRELN